MDDTKWDAMIKEATDKGHLTNMKECEDILEDMLHWDKLLPEISGYNIQHGSKGWIVVIFYKVLRLHRIDFTSWFCNC